MEPQHNLRILQLDKQMTGVTHRSAVDGVGGVGGSAHEIQRAFVVLVAQFHLRPFAPHRRQVIHILELYLR